MFATGFLTKFVDAIVDDGLKVRKAFAYAAGIIYGVLIAYMITAYPLVAPLCIAIVLAVLITKKIDRRPHNIGIAVMFLSLALLGFPKVDPLLLAIFLISGALDEIGNDLPDKGRFKGTPRRILRFRIITEMAALLVSLVTGYWIIFLAILSFDIGYLITKKMVERF